MSSRFIKVEVSRPDFSEYGEFETSSKFNRPTVDRKYIKILSLCLSYASASVIYPNTKHPIMKQVRDLCRAGYLNRYKRAGDRRYYYKTTYKGYDLIIEALNISK